MKKIFFKVLFFLSAAMLGQTFSGSIIDKETKALLSNVEITLVEDGQKITTSSNGEFAFTVPSNASKTLYINKEGYVFEEIRNQLPSNSISVELRARKISSATVRWNNYLEDCENYENPSIPKNLLWNLEFEETNLTGDLVPNFTFTRRDPSAVIKYNNLYYVWYTYKLSETSTYFKSNNLNDNVFPWDNADVYYATSVDGYNWKEQGAAVVRGSSGAFDDRSVFTPEIFVHKNKFYLVYQSIKFPYVERVKNDVAMAVANSPNGPWKKLAKPILRAANNGVWTAGSTSRLDADVQGDFDSHKVHDPCIMFYKNKFYLYYKGERMGEKRYCKNQEREIRWGVAIADNPEGPYTKSEYNPITTTGHEVSVWNYNDGIAIIQKLDGPEINTVQFAADGVNFEAMGTANEVPDALGIFRDGVISKSDPKFGVTWGLAHKLVFNNRQVKGGWMHLTRFDRIEKEEVSISLAKSSVTLLENETLDIDYTTSPPTIDDNEICFYSSDSNIATVNEQGVVTGLNIGQATITISTSSEEKELLITVTPNASLITVQAEDFIPNRTGGTYDDSSSGGPGLGVNATATGINFVNSGDWLEFEVNFPESGVYDLSYLISSPNDRAEVQLEIDGNLVATDQVPNNNSFDQFEKLNSVSNIQVESGIRLLRVTASGLDTWQWNLDSFSFTKNNSITLSAQDNIFIKDQKLRVYPNPSEREISITNLVGINEYLIVNLHGVILQEGTIESTERINIENLSPGPYFLRLNNNGKTVTIMKK